MKKAIGSVALVVVVGGLVLVGVLAVTQTVDEVDADATTTGTVTEHTETPHRTGITRGCSYSYEVDGTAYSGNDQCDQDRHPVGSQVQVNYVEQRPDRSILGGDVTSGDAVARWVAILGAFGVLFAVLLWVGRPGRRTAVEAGS